MKRIAFAVPLLVAASPALAHLDPVAHGSFAAGFSHPLFGADHILTMVAAGLWAGILGGRAMLAVPAAFMGAMAIGFGLAMAGVELPLVEPMILASVVVIGVLVGLAVRIDMRAAMAIVAVFALFHGHAHGGELGGAGAASFATGFLLATALLHAAGIGLGLVLARNAFVSRALGALTAAVGVFLAMG